MEPYLEAWSAKFSDEGFEGREGGAVAEWKCRAVAVISGKTKEQRSSFKGIYERVHQENVRTALIVYIPRRPKDSVYPT